MNEALKPVQSSILWASHMPGTLGWLHCIRCKILGVEWWVLLLLSVWLLQAS